MVNLFALGLDKSLIESLDATINGYGYDVVSISEPIDSNFIKDHPPGIILYDYDRVEDGLSASLETIRANSDHEKTPILVLSSGDGEIPTDIENPSCELIKKPINVSDLTLRIISAFNKAASTPSKIEVCGIELVRDEHRVRIDGKNISLAPMEYRLLEFFMDNPEKLHTREQLLLKVWGRRDFIGERTVDVHVRRVRRILEVHGRAELIQTVRAYGYRFSENL